MTWLRLDDGFAQHRKVMLLTDRAFRLHVTAMLHCAEQLTDGLVVDGVAGFLTRAPSGRALRSTVQELEQAGLWERVESGWMIHDFADWNPSADTVRAKRTAAKERMHLARSQSVRANRKRTESEQGDGFARSSRSPARGRATGTGSVPSDVSGSPPVGLLADQPDRSGSREGPEASSGIVSDPIGPEVAGQVPSEAAEAGRADGNGAVRDPWGLTPPLEPDPTQQVFDYWAVSLWPKVHPSGRSPKATPKRMAKIRARLAEGYTVDDLKAVIDRVPDSAHHMGDNDSRTPYIDPDTIFCNAERVDRWLAKPAPGLHRGTTRAASHQAAVPGGYNVFDLPTKTKAPPESPPV